MTLEPTLDFIPGYRVVYWLTPYNTRNFKTVFEIGSEAEVNRLITDEEFIASLIKLSTNPTGFIGSVIKWVTSGQGPSLPGVGFVYPTAWGWLGLTKNAAESSIEAGLKPELDYLTFSGRGANTAPDYIISLESEPYHKSLYRYKIYSSVWIDFAYVMTFFNRGFFSYLDRSWAFIDGLGLPFIDQFADNLSIASRGYTASLLSCEEIIKILNEQLINADTKKLKIRDYRFLPGTPAQAHKLFGGRLYADGPEDSYSTSYFLEGINPSFVGSFSRFRTPKSIADAYEKNMINLGDYFDLWKKGEGGYPTSLMFSLITGGTSDFSLVNAPFDIGYILNASNESENTLGLQGYPPIQRKISCPVGATASDTGVKVFALRPFTAYAIPYGVTINNTYIPSAVINTIFIDVEPIREEE